MTKRDSRRCPQCGYTVRLVKRPNMAVLGTHRTWSGLATRKPVSVECSGSGVSVGWRS